MLREKRIEVARRTLIACGMLGVAALVLRDLVPVLVASKLRRTLAAQGFPEARFRVDGFGLDRLELADVVLAPGLTLGTVVLDAGVSLLWRDPATITVRGARVESSVVARQRPSSSDGGRALRTLRVEASTLVHGEVEIAVSGTIDLAAAVPSAQLVATAPMLHAGRWTLRDATARMDGGRVSVSGRAGAVTMEARATLGSWSLEDLAISWHAHGGGWDASGRARLAGSPRVGLRDGHAVARAARWSRAGLALEEATVTATFSGDLDGLDAVAELRVARARVRLGDDARPAAPAAPAAQLFDAVLPVEVHARVAADGWRVETGALVVHARELAAAMPSQRVRATGVVVTLDRGGRAPMQWTARSVQAGDLRLVHAAGTLARDHAMRWHAAELRDARWPEMRIVLPVGRIAGGALTIRGPRMQWRDVAIEGIEATLDERHRELRWRAHRVTRGRDVVEHVTGATASERGVHTVSWSWARLGPLELGAGDLALSSSAGRWLLTSGSVAAYRGRLSVARPAAIAEAIELDVRGVALEPMLQAISGRIDGRGVLDGRLVLRGGELERLSLEARGPGTLRVRDRRWIDGVVASIAAGHAAVPERVSSTLADFEYARLALAATRASVALTVRGRGRRVAQDLDLVINVRGLQAAARAYSRTRRRAP